jgi:hypothetical protein
MSLWDKQTTGVIISSSQLDRQTQRKGLMQQTHKEVRQKAQRILTRFASPVSAFSFAAWTFALWEPLKALFFHSLVTWEPKLWRDFWREKMMKLVYTVGSSASPWTPCLIFCIIWSQPFKAEFHQHLISQHHTGWHTGRQRRGHSKLIAVA